MKGFIIWLALLVPAFSFAQNQGTITVRKKTQNNEVIDVSTDYSSILTDNDSLFTVVEVMPSFTGGAEKMYEYLSKNIKVHSHITDSRTIYCQFVIEKDGSVSTIKFLRDSTINQLIKKEITDALVKMPKWKPGLQFGEPVRVRYTLPILFCYPR